MKVYLENRWSHLVTVLDVQPREHETSYSWTSLNGTFIFVTTFLVTPYMWRNGDKNILEVAMITL